MIWTSPFPEDWDPIRGRNIKRKPALSRIHPATVKSTSFQNATSNLTVQKANHGSLAQQELQAQGGAVRQHDKPTTSWFPTHLSHRKQCPCRQLWRPIFPENGPQSAPAKLPEWAESPYGLFATAQAPTFEPGWVWWFRVLRLACRPPTHST